MEADANVVLRHAKHRFFPLFLLALKCAFSESAIFSDLMEADANVVLHLQVGCRGAPATASATAPARRVPVPTGLNHRIRMV